VSHRGDAGFTLVELLVAFVALGLLLVALAGGLRFGARSWDAVGDAAERQERVVNTQAFLRARLGSYSRQGPDGPVDPEPFAQLSGDTDHLAFVAPWTVPGATSGLHAFDLRVDPDRASAGRTKRLVLSWRPADPSRRTFLDGIETEGERTLLTDVESLDIAFLRPDHDEGGVRWLSAWPADGTSPQLVRIALRFSDPSRRWPTLVIKPRR
jgi:prepilin-type N-terminal cleavage/methylation domain-containing protein